MYSVINSTRHLRMNLCSYLKSLSEYRSRENAFSCILCSQYYKMPKRDKDIKRNEIYIPISLMNMDTRILNQNGKSNSVIYKKDYRLQPSGIYPRYVRLVQHLKINLCNPSHQQIKEQKSHDPINRCRKST